MIRRRSKALGPVLAAALLTGCGEGGLLTGRDAAPLDLQAVHPSGTVIQVLAVRVGGDRTAVDLMVMNGNDRELRLNQGRENTFILTDGGERLLLIPPAGNPNLAVPGTRAADLTLVFEGALPRRGSATLTLNESGSADSSASSNPRFQISLPLDGAGGSPPEVSTMANLRPVPMTSLSPSASQGSTMGTGGQGTSSLQRVEALRSELGAVETDRGTVVSLPGDVTFDFDESSIRSDARPTLDRLAELITAGGEGAISIEGHTDSRGDDAYNQRLSLARAEAVKAYLVDKGVSSDRLRTIGLGETRPVAPNANPDGSDNEAGRQQNRRVEVILPGAQATSSEH